MKNTLLTQFCKLTNSDTSLPKNTFTFKVLLGLFFMLLGMGVSWGQNPTNGGFELDGSVTTTPNSWTTTGTTTTTNARTGSYALVSNGSTSTSNVTHSNSTTIAVAINGYGHTIVWAKGSNNFSNASTGGSLNTTTSSTSTSNIGTTLTRLTYDSAKSTAAVNFTGRISSRSSTSGNSTQVYFDDMIIYTDATATTDLVKPNAATVFTNGTISSSSIGFSWTAGTDAATGVQNTIILRTTNLSAVTPVMNDQGIYSTAGTTAGPNVVSTDWTVISTSVAAATLTYSDATVVAGTSYKYAVIHRDLAYNYSVALVSGTITTSSAATPTLAITANTTAAFGSVCTNASPVTKTYTITNTGTAASNVVVTSSNAEYVVGALSSTDVSATNGTVTFDVTYTPSSGSTGTTLTSKYDTSTASGTLGLTGMAVAPITQIVSTSAATLVVNTTATLNGNYSTAGVCPATSEKGFVYAVKSTNADPLVLGTGVTQSTVSLGSPASYLLAIASLTPVTTYTYKAYVYNGTDYTYGAATDFTTLSTATATYTVASTTSVTTTGTAPSGSSATYAQTFGTLSQMTSTNSTTLTLIGYAGYKITGFVLNMKSNSSAGAGDMTVIAGSTNIYTIPTATAFSTTGDMAWNSPYSTTYANIPSKTPTVYSIQSGENVVFKITASTNSLYIASYSITYDIASTTWTTTWSNGTPRVSVDAVINGNYDTTTNGVFSAKTLTVNSGKTFTINTGHNITVAGAVTNNGTFTVENNANLIQGGTTNSNTGNIFVKRDSDNMKLYDYTLWSSPVTNVNEFLTTFSPSTLTTRFYTYNFTDNVYNVVSDPAATNFARATGYLIRAPNNWTANTSTTFNGTFTGVPNNGTIEIPGLLSEKYYAVGNPYPSTINVDAFYTENPNAGTLYFWRRRNGDVSTTAYATTNSVGGTFTSGGLTPSADISVGQGFFVSPSADMTLNFTNAMRVTPSTSAVFLRTTTEERSRFWLNLTNTSGAFSQMLVGYMPEATSGVDNAIDGKYINDAPIALTSIINSEEYTIQGRALPFATKDIVPLGFKTNAAGNYTIAIDHVDGLFSTGQAVFLKDNLLNTVVDLSAGGYSFASAIGTFNSRFEVVYQSTLSVTNPTFTANSVIAFSANGEIRINSGSTIMELVRVYDLQGRLLVEKKQINASETKLSTTATNQVLLVEITAANGSKITKKIIQ